MDRNAGILGGKFMERSQVLRPGSSLVSPQGPCYYTPVDLYVGGKIEVLSHHFVLLDADEYVFNYMESDPLKFKHSDRQSIKAKTLQILSQFSKEQKEWIYSQFLKTDSHQQGWIDRKAFIDIIKSVIKNGLSDHVIIIFLNLKIFIWIRNGLHSQEDLKVQVVN